ncbi:DUF1801 domain-containing protein [Sphingomicrobium lutaoense]|uniref:Uncharacterized protein YdhG (YjbR/CyaY superfamily) n=1 Tax=Sphingomicrobium lutaoense TaxID=515949 RepID=A0A839YZC2_9SPHN|nr:DUF1801 domain-containing protein [Sphingomicrobium lutaoense]MBB3764479.1 uncharacterized protein YdhG (YjbR/CyaY superfamily) [Sphingomicrobium lutaoense]
MVQSSARTVADYLARLPEDRRAVIADLRERINAAMPEGYREEMAFGMIGWTVPLDVSGPTYNGQPLGYVSLAAQKRHNALYLNCSYISKEAQARLEAAHEKAGLKLDMGKSCIRFKGADDLAWDAIAKEIASLTPGEFVAAAEKARTEGSC